MQFLSDIPPAALFFAGVAACVVIGGIAQNLRWALAAFALMLFSASVSFALDPATDEVIPTLFTPIQLYRNFIFIFGGALCYLAIFVHLGKFNKDSINPIGLFLVAIIFYAGCVRILNGNVEIGLLSFGLAIFSIVPFVTITPNLLQTRDQIHTLMRWILLVMGVWIIMNTVQYIADPFPLMPGMSKRFQGLTGNPQFAAVLFAFSLVATTWVTLNDPSKVIRLFAVATATALGICLVWTGSRTGFLMAAVGMSIILASRVGQFILAAPFIGAFAFFFLKFVLGDAVDLNADRLVSGEDTRTHMWANQIRVFLENPLFGSGDPNAAGASENSYLLSFSAYGIFMGFIVLAFLATSMLLVLKLYKNRSSEDKLGKAMTDFAIAGIIMYFLGGMTEGYMMARIHTATLFVAIAGIVGYRLLSTRDERFAAGAHQHAYAHEDDHHDDHPYAEHEHTPREDVYLPEDDHHPRENVWEPAEDWQGQHSDERVNY